MTETEAEKVWHAHVGALPVEVAQALRFHVFYSSIKAAGVRLVNDRVKIDYMTPNIWVGMTVPERRAWMVYWNIIGHVCFQCPICDFPVSSGGAPCDFCDSKHASSA